MGRIHNIFFRVLFVLIMISSATISGVEVTATGSFSVKNNHRVAHIEATGVFNGDPQGLGFGFVLKAISTTTQAPTPGTLIQSSGYISQTSFIFDDFVLQGPGTYVFEVTAIDNLPDHSQPRAVTQVTVVAPDDLQIQSSAQYYRKDDQGFAAINVTEYKAVDSWRFNIRAVSCPANTYTPGAVIELSPVDWSGESYQFNPLLKYPGVYVFRVMVVELYNPISRTVDITVRTPPPVPPCRTCPCPSPLAGTGNRSSIIQSVTKPLSSADNLSLQFLHAVTDYRLTASGGCAPCGSAAPLNTGMPRLTIDRILAPGYHSSGSLGWGAYLGTDLRLNVTGAAVTLQDPRSASDTDFWRDGSGQPTIGDSHFAKAIKAVDATSALVSVDTATKVVIDGWNDQTLIFELSSTINGGRLGRLLRVADANGNATVLTYRYVAADMATDTTNGGKWWAVATIKGPAGDIATCTTAATPVGDAYPITAIALPDGKTLTYTYGALATVGGVALSGLTDIAHPDGSHTTISGLANANGGLDLSIVDPAESDPAHQAKTVSLTGPTWVDPWTGTIAPWRVQTVRNGAGEVAYANQRIVNGTELWTVINDHGAFYRIVTDQAGNILRTDQTTAPVVWTTDPATWPWQALATYSISGLSRLDQSTDVLGRIQKWTNNASTGLVTDSTDAAGKISSYQLDGNGRTTQETDRLGRITVYTRDTQGNALTTTRASGTPDATTESATYDARGLRLTRSNGLGQTWNYTYDTTGRLMSETQPPDVLAGTRGVTTYGYDTAGHLTSIKDPLSRTTTFAYDARNRLTQTTYGDATYELTTYGTGALANVVVAKRDRNGVVTTYGYDAAGRRTLTATLVTRADGSQEAITESTTYLPGTELTASVTRRGETTAYLYDFRNRRIAATVYATKTKTLTTTWTYDVADRRLTETDPYGRVTRFVYDALDRVIRTVRESVPGGFPTGADPATIARLSDSNPAYVIEESSYDAESQLLARTDARGVVTTFTYDQVGRLASQTEASGSPDAGTTTFTYDLAGNQTQIQSPRGFLTTKAYTGRSLLKSVTEAAGRPEQGTTSYLYALDGRVTTTTDANTKATITSYSTCCARVTQLQDPLGFLTKFTYDGVGNRLTVTDGNNLTTTTAYDALGRPKTRTDALGKVWTYTYDDNLTDGVGLDLTYVAKISDLGFGRDAVTGFGADGSAVAIKDPNGNETLTIYDGLGRTLRTVDALGQATTVAYDGLVSDTATSIGGVTATVTLVATTATDPLAHASTRWTDGLGVARVSIDALGKRSRVDADAGGNARRTRDANGVGQDCVYDARGRVTSCADTATGSTHGVVTTAYDAVGNRTSRTDALGKSEGWVYDARNRVQLQQDRLLAQTLFTYDPVGNLLTITDAEGGVTTYVYDARNLLSSETFPPPTGGTRTYTYDGGRRLKTRTDQASGVATYTYDNANHLTTRAYADAKNDTFTYDAGGRLTKAVSARYGSTIARVYDKANRITSEALTLGTETWTVKGGYDAANRLTGITLPDGTAEARTFTERNQLAGATLAGISVATRTYDDGGRLIETRQGNTRVETRGYISGDQLVASIVTPGATSFSYTYDAIKRKTAEIDLITPSNTQRFSYDDADRLKTWDRITGTAGAVETSQSWVLSPVGDWTSTTRDSVVENRTHTKVHEIATIGGVALTNDVKGNLTRDQQGQQFVWDVENRLASASALVQQAGVTGATYIYDALGRRVRKTVGPIETTFVSWGAQEVYQLQRNPTAIAADQPPTTATDGSAVPVTSGSTYPSGALLADASAVRVSFRPSSVPAPAGWLADTGLIYGVRTGGQSYGWVGAAQNQTVNRDWLGWTLYDTFNQLWTNWATAGSTPATWELAVANGTYPVSIVCGDAHAIQQRNDLLLEGVTLLDPNPWNGVAANPTTGPLGNFVALSGLATVTDGKLTLTAAPTAKAPKICFIEVGAVGTTFDANYAARASAALAQVKARTALGRPDAVKPVSTIAVFGSYVDELLGYRVQSSTGPYAVKSSYWVNSNHLYSVACVTNSAGAVVERYSYNAFGAQGIKNGTGVVIGKSGVGLSRGFTSYTMDGESGLYYARARMFSAKSGRFISRDPKQYINGYSTYVAAFTPNLLDPNGTEVVKVGCHAISTKESVGFYALIGGSITADLNGEVCDCYDECTKKKTKGLAIDVRGGVKAEVGVGAGSHFTLAGYEIAYELKGPSIVNFSQGYVTRECGGEISAGGGGGFEFTAGGEIAFGEGFGISGSLLASTKIEYGLRLKDDEVQLYIQALGFEINGQIEFFLLVGSYIKPWHFMEKEPYEAHVKLFSVK